MICAASAFDAATSNTNRTGATTKKGRIAPQVGIATLALLEKFGFNVNYPLDQTCCGQPLSNSGLSIETRKISLNFIKNFFPYDYIVSPSGSCVLHVKEHLNIQEENEAARTVREKIYELSDFISDFVDISSLKGSFYYRVGLHQSCHGLRGLKNGKASELAGTEFSKPMSILSRLNGIQLIDLDRQDECCGFGGTFSIFEEAVSVRMGKDRIRDHLRHDAEIITSTDMSCLMHLEGLIRREKTPLRVMHIAEILNQAIT